MRVLAGVGGAETEHHSAWRAIQAGGGSGAVWGPDQRRAPDLQADVRAVRAEQKHSYVMLRDKREGHGHGPCVAMAIVQLNVQ